MRIVRIIAGLIFIPLFSFFSAFAVEPEMVYKPYIRSVQLLPYGTQQGLPIYVLNSGDRMLLSFDDMEGRLKNYYYSYVLCDYNWQPVNLSPLDYLKGFTQNRIGTYRYSSIALTRYTHYQVTLPEANAVPTRSGNYILTVFLDGDPSKLVLTRRLYVLEQKAVIAAHVTQPASPQYFSTHQKIKFSANLKELNSFSAAQQVKAVILQNNRWDNAKKDIPPTYVRGNVLEFNSENIIFDGGKEWRWLDLRSFSLQSDRVEKANYNKASTEIFLKVDVDRSAQRYLYFPDYNGMYQLTNNDRLNPFWQGDYATVHFYFAPPDGIPYAGKSLYLGAAFTDYALTDEWQLTFNEETKLYETKTILKQGYYNYTYFLAGPEVADKRALEGSYWETENSYTILLYYKGLSDRNDQLIGISSLNSRRDRAGFSF